MNILSKDYTLEITGIQGVQGREVKSVSKITKEVIIPEDPSLRFQLGKVTTEHINQHGIRGVQDPLSDEKVTYFKLLAWGPSWEHAAARYRAIYLSGAVEEEPAK